jgi:hypothetical protein
MKPKINVTQLEQFRRYMSGHYDYMTKQDMIETMTGEFQGNTKTRIGSALHFIVESGADDLEVVGKGTRTYTYYGKPVSEPLPGGFVVPVDEYKVVFDPNQVETILSYRKQHSQVFHEVKTRVDYGNAILTGMADIIEGMEIRDMKTKFSTPNDSDYIDSVQWMAYLDMFGANRFSFDLFEFVGYDEAKHGYDVRNLELCIREPIVLYPFKNMHQNIINLLDELLDWCRNNNIELKQIEL